MQKFAQCLIDSKPLARGEMVYRLLGKYNDMPGAVAVLLTIFSDSVKAEIEEFSQTKVLGWFQDEVAALAAICERQLMRSAILPELRRLPLLLVRCEYRTSPAGHEAIVFHRGTVAKRGGARRRIVLLPGARAKTWLCL